MVAAGARPLVTLAAGAALALAGCGRRGDGNRAGGIASAEPTRVAVRVECSDEPAFPQPGRPRTWSWPAPASKEGSR